MTHFRRFFSDEPLLPNGLKACPFELEQRDFEALQRLSEEFCFTAIIRAKEEEILQGA